MKIKNLILLSIVAVFFMCGEDLRTATAATWGYPRQLTVRLTLPGLPKEPTTPGKGYIYHIREVLGGTLYSLDYEHDVRGMVYSWDSGVGFH